MYEVLAAVIQIKQFRVVRYDFFQNNSNVGTLFGIKLRGAHLKIYLRAIFMKQPHIDIIIERKLIVDASRKDIKQKKMVDR